MIEPGDMLVLTKYSEWHNPGCLLFVRETVDEEKVKCTYFVECLSCGKGDRQYVRDISIGEHTRNFECIMEYKELSTHPRWEPLFPDPIEDASDFFLQCVDSTERVLAVVPGLVQYLDEMRDTGNGDEETRLP